MPRLPPSLIWKAHSISPLAATLLPVCRDIPSALTELRWIREHVQSTSASASSSALDGVRLRRLCRERGKGVPLQYVLGTQPFGNLDIKCRPGVLIPRSEPEAYTTHLSRLLKTGHFSPRSQPLRIIDFCTGTGCIALLLYSNLSSSFPHLDVTGVDISPKAISLSNTNLQHNVSLGLIPPPSPSHSLTFQQSDIFSPAWLSPESEGKWDVIISNPPYISPRGFATDCSRSVRNHEPKLAQVPLPRPDAAVRRQEDVFYARLLDIGAVVRPKVMLFEVGGMDQALRVVRLVGERMGMGEWEVEVWRDWPDGRAVEGEERSVRVDGVGEVPVRGSGHGRSVLVYRR
ncbi:HemK family methyltransferase [Coniochaeta ligniaria NRRL 30616]|uniref:peptide chain release factor N(5)-glutamine methyltransferase n=1 Tax=Coniochaeta ligniaria NRRL 30616 TaxID=1408157 RepID=A0A1J7IRU7_9PEZI|nr:HemK family methyltransferase [Coniochaeta ligniaria NRRL 30616]